MPNLTSDLFDLQPAFVPAVQSAPISNSSSAWGGAAHSTHTHTPSLMPPLLLYHFRSLTFNIVPEKSLEQINPLLTCSKSSFNYLFVHSQVHSYVHCLFQILTSCICVPFTKCCHEPLSVLHFFNVFERKKTLILTKAAFPVKQ